MKTVDTHFWLYMKMSQHTQTFYFMRTKCFKKYEKTIKLLLNYQRRSSLVFLTKMVKFD